MNVQHFTENFEPNNLLLKSEAHTPTLNILFTFDMNSIDVYLLLLLFTSRLAKRVSFRESYY